MPRDGSGIFTAPFPNVVTATTIESPVHNGTVSDFVTDANAARPIIAGGTGATSAAAARTNLQAEVASAVVSSYATHVFQSGSFVSFDGATDEPPEAGHFTGNCVVLSAPDYIEIEARSPNTNNIYVRNRTPGGWSAWIKKAQSLNDGSGNEGISVTNGDMWYGVRGTAPSSYFAVNSESDLSGTDLFTVNKAGGALCVGGARVQGSGSFGGTNVGIEMFVAGSVSYIQSYNRSSPQVSELKILGFPATSFDYPVSILHTLASSSPTTGALVVAGGVGVGGAVVAGTGFITTTPAGNYAYKYAPSSGSSVHWGSFVFAGTGTLNFDEVGVASWFKLNPAALGGKVEVLSTTASSSPSTGALVVAGGVGVGGSVVASAGLTATGSLGAIPVNSLGMDNTRILSVGPTPSTFNSINFWQYTSDLSSYGVPMQFNTAGIVVIPGTTPSSSPTTGALTVNGGVGINGGLYLAADVHVSGVMNAVFRGGPGGPISTTAPDANATNLVFYNYGSSNWAGMGADVNGAVHLINGTGAPATRIHLTPGGVVSLPTNIASSSPTTGALVVAGGVGIGGELRTIDKVYIGGTMPTTVGRLNISGATVSSCIMTRNGIDGLWGVGFENAAGTVVGNITVAAGSTAYNTTSDERLKDDMQPLDAGGIIDAIEVYDFRWKGTDKRSHGVSAQRARDVYPLAVTYTEAQDWWGVDYSKFVPLLLQEIKALRQRINTIETRH